MTPYDSKTVSQFTSCCRSCRSCSIMWKREVRHFSAQLYWSCVHALGYMKFRMKKICFLANTQNKIGIDILTFLFSEIWKSKYDPRKHSSDDNFHYLLSWLDVVCICKLDIAIGNAHERSLWLNSLHTMDSKAVDEYGHTPDSIRWLIRRGARTTRIRITRTRLERV